MFDIEGLIFFFCNKFQHQSNHRSNEKNFVMYKYFGYSFLTFSLCAVERQEADFYF